MLVSVAWCGLVLLIWFGWVITCLVWYLVCDGGVAGISACCCLASLVCSLVTLVLLTMFAVVLGVLLFDFICSLLLFKVVCGCGLSASVALWCLL